ncbi:MAG TPA: YceI family protein [Solirubrobacteraceae bacterium]|nr:YceI family protein [Solirubrobacteraceae bacterium]
MSSTAVATATQLPVGTWKLDPTHSTAGFAVKHMGVSMFRGRFEDFDATLTVGEDGAGELVGAVRADSIVVKDDNLKAHLGSPEFFDTERYPELRYVAQSLTRDGDELIADGELTIKDHTHPVRARGSITDPTETLGGAIKVGITLEAAIDRTEYGLSFNAPLPSGGVALANDVRLIVELELAQAEA